MLYIYVICYICIYLCIYIYIFVYLFINLFDAGIVNMSQKCDEAKVEQRIKKILKDAPDHQGGSRRKAKEGK